MAKNESILDRLYKVYCNPVEISGSKMAEESLNRFKKSIIGEK